MCVCVCVCVSACVGRHLLHAAGGDKEDFQELHNACAISSIAVAASVWLRQALRGLRKLQVSISLSLRKVHLLCAIPFVRNSLGWAFAELMCPEKFRFQNEK